MRAWAPRFPNEEPALCLLGGAQATDQTIMAGPPTLAGGMGDDAMQMALARGSHRMTDRGSSRGGANLPVGTDQNLVGFPPGGTTGIIARDIAWS